MLTPSGKPAITLNGTTAKLERTATLRGFPNGNAARTMFLAARYNSNSAWAGVGAGWLIQAGTISGGNGTLYKDGAQIAQFAHAYNTTLNKLVIGQEIDGSGYAAMDVAAILVYDRALNAAERAQVETYLRDKFLVVSAGREAAFSDADGSLPPSVAITQPQLGALLGRGSGQELSVDALGSGALSYQWFRNGVALPGAAAPNLTRLVAQVSDAGVYAVGVSNAVGDANASVVVDLPSAPSRAPHTPRGCPPPPTRAGRPPGGGF